MALSTIQIERLRFLESAEGILTPESVVKDASSPDSPLHDLITWDDGEAAAKRRIDEARAVIRQVKVVITTEEFSFRAPFYARDPALGKQAGYRAVEALRVDRPAARETLIGELKRAAGHLTRTRHLAVALGLANEFDELVRRVTGLQFTLEATDDVVTAPEPPPM